MRGVVGPGDALRTVAVFAQSLDPDDPLQFAVCVRSQRPSPIA
jgi:hypothetical protein